MRQSNYDKFPFIAVTDALHPCLTGWDKIAAELQRAINRGRVGKPILVVECYPGVDELAVLNELKARLAPKLVIHAAEAYHVPEKIEKLVAPFMSEDDSAFGRFSNLSLVNFFNAEPLWRLRRRIDKLKEGLVLIVGCGASLIAWGHILVYADLARRMAEQRFRRNETGNLCIDNKTVAANLKRKRAFFVDWRIADRWKQPLIKRWDYVLDTNNPVEPKLADAADVRSGMREAVKRPFRLVPIFDPDRSVENFGLGSDCVPEESSLLLGFGDIRLEIPAINLVFYQPQALLGDEDHSKFGQFPIRFNFLDTKDSGRAGLRELDFIETHRDWFTKKVQHRTNGSVNVLNLVEGEEAVIESPTDAFAPFVVHYAETFIVPAAVEEYTIGPHGPSIGKECATMKTFVRVGAWA